MKKNPEFILKEIGNEIVLVPFGNKAVNFNGMVTFNETAKFLWENAVGDFNENSLALCLIEEYDVDMETAIITCRDFIRSLGEVGAIE